ncbi:CO dehydrogenase/acetyl-CoA synthase, acetyl-CoA synthase subunit [Thermodesulfovibrio sp. N1]|uniref:acetyl-CoA decarbonylase/synthase complex subunit alpha/beta n=1 Tax=unclassified Thermodesulfovibrio TaxID=2645936 RepID=UPI00083A8AF1|nr:MULTISPECIES: acetyl-CoA decarbonylase/synthase complex subunit alpha/beta [unclassified Thermodesulfovibrio]MDI1472299.1 acetyl-CoA decarbonylase/synthase complex subunit alpha/beta [Thermodesulfovibrio sp. 1176]ODA44937.1 CO dehydrogenase/acetyl-CoA synthase, acetyl-CoA synthase subunit [Thermodesulfovibrio sp. N1]
MIDQILEITRKVIDNLSDKINNLLKIVSKKGIVSFELPDTAYGIPLIYALEGIKINRVDEMKKFLEEIIPKLKNQNDLKNLGLAYLYIGEIYLTLQYINQENKETPYYGFLGDTIQRTLGVQLVDGRIPAVAVLLGELNPDDLLKIVKELQEKKILTFLIGPVAEEFITAGERFGFEAYVVPVGKNIEETLYVIDWALRASLIFGGQTPGQKDAIIDYVRKRVNAFAISFGQINELAVATASVAMFFACPVIIDQDLPEIIINEIAEYPLLVTEKDYSKIVKKAIETRGLKIVVEKPPIPVSYGPAFEGERVRKEDTFIEFGGQRTPAFELVQMKDLTEIEDEKIHIIGKEWQFRYEKGGQMPLGIIINVAGKKMQKDFEPVIERQIHTFINEAEGLWHIGQRDINWIRISKKAKEAGITLEHLGVILTTMTKARFRSIVDKVEVYLYINQEDVINLRQEARKQYKERDLRLAKLTDEDVDKFYSCLLCQSFAPKHVCVITPERPGLCGAFTWLDAKAAYEIEPTGGNQPVEKGELLDPVYGRYSGIDEYVKKHSGGETETINLYSIMENPMTSCGCFECIVAVVPEANGVLIVNRGYGGMTPIGMKFSTLAGMIGGGVQTPGFMGVGVNYITSRKFLKGDGGIRRIVWMPKELKERIKESFKKRVDEEGISDLMDKIADETVCEDIECLLEFLTKVNHPALEMEPIIK